MKRPLLIAICLGALAAAPVAVLGHGPAAAPPANKAPQATKSAPVAARSQVEEPVVCPMIPSLDNWRRARRYVAGQSGRRSLSVITSTGQPLNYQGSERYRTASLIKAMIAVAVARRYKSEEMPSWVKQDLAVMVRSSDNKAASRLYELVGEQRLVALAQTTGMQDFEPAAYWGLHELTSRDQALFFHKLNRLLPRRHKFLVRNHLASITPAQRWGIPKGLPPGYLPLFKGGWREGPSWGIITHQAARVEFEQKPCQHKAISIALLSDRNENWTQGQRIAEHTTRLLTSQ